MRFACENAVGLGGWGAELQLTLPRPAPPAPPRLTLASPCTCTGHNCTAIIQWEQPEDNGAAVLHYQLQLRGGASNQTDWYQLF